MAMQRSGEIGSALFQEVDHGIDSLSAASPYITLGHHEAAHSTGISVTNHGQFICGCFFS